MTTRAEKKAALQHILVDVLEVDSTSPIVLALDKIGVTGIVDFVALKLNVHEPLKYDKPAVDTTPLGKESKLTY